MNNFPVFIPSTSNYVRPRKRKLQYPDGKGFINNKEKLELFRKHYYKKDRHQLAKLVGCCVETINEMRKKLDLPIKNKKKPAKKFNNLIGYMMEDYFYFGLSILQIAKKYKTSHPSVSRYISFMIPVKMTENTSVINMKSKV